MKPNQKSSRSSTRKAVLNAGKAAGVVALPPIDVSVLFSACKLFIPSDASERAAHKKVLGELRMRGQLANRWVMGSGTDKHPLQCRDKFWLRDTLNKMARSAANRIAQHVQELQKPGANTEWANVEVMLGSVWFGMFEFRATYHLWRCALVL